MLHTLVASCGPNPDTGIYELSQPAWRRSAPVVELPESHLLALAFRRPFRTPGPNRSVALWFSITANPRRIQAADAEGCCSLAPMMMSHSMMATSPNITGKTQLDTLCSYCGHNMPVTLVAR